MEQLSRIILIAVGILFTFIDSYCQSGTIDSSFGTNGIAIFGGTFREALSLKDLVVKSDQSIILVGEYATIHPTQGNYSHYFTLLKTDPWGKGDPTFIGQYLTLVDKLSAGANKAVLQPDGKIVAAGFSGRYENNADFAIVRFLPGGGIDSSFGANGKVITDFGSNVGEEAVDLLLQGDGKIIAIGNSGGSTTGNSKVVMARYNSNGSLDSSFGVQGKFVSFLFSGYSNYVSTACLQEDGKIVIGGYTKNGFGFIARLKTNGFLDSSFNVNGIEALGGDQIVSSITSTLAVQSVKARADGKIVACGNWEKTLASDTVKNGAFVIRLNEAGSFDNTFGSGGKAIFPDVVKNFWDWAYARNLNVLALQNDGKVVAAGVAQLSGTMLIRLNSDGSLDSSFNKTGIANSPLYLREGRVESVDRLSIGADGKILLLGLIQNPGYSFVTRNFGGTAPLPVTMTFFTARQSRNLIRLNWATATELNSDQFIVQRSLDSIYFKDIAFIAARGLSTITTNYKYDDIMSSTTNGDIFYYRICTQDKDRKQSFSIVRKVVFYPYETLSLAPNPVGANTLLRFQSLSQQKAVVRIIDAKGVVVLSKQVEALEGANNIDLATGILNKGSYQIQFSTADFSKTISMLKL
jgi:uncharacterized delta-60 repeat protein